MPNLSCGIVGLPNVGKSTLFNALTKKAVALAANYPFCTIDPNIGIVDLEDERLEKLSLLSKSKKIIPAYVTFVDIAGLVAGASKGEGLGNKFLGNIRETDAIVHVVRCFENDDVIHVAGKVDPVSDIEIINLELILADLQMAENTVAKLEKQAKSNNKELAPQIDTLKRAIEHLSDNKPIRSLESSEESEAILRKYPFLTKKRVIYAANVSEIDLPEMDNNHVRAVKKFAQAEGSAVIPICAKLEEELSGLDPAEAKEFLQSLGLQEAGLPRLTREAFNLLELVNYITTGDVETRAWTIRKGVCAQEAAGEIHTDIKKGFIRAEVVSFEDLMTFGSRAKAREAGKARAEGKDYIVKDGDVILFFHN